jgi:hypothetical protein
MSVIKIKKSSFPFFTAMFSLATLIFLLACFSIKTAHLASLFWYLKSQDRIRGNVGEALVNQGLNPP